MESVIGIEIQVLARKRGGVLYPVREVRDAALQEPYVSHDCTRLGNLGSVGPTRPEAEPAS